MKKLKSTFIFEYNLPYMVEYYFIIMGSSFIWKIEKSGGTKNWHVVGHSFYFFLKGRNGSNVNFVY